MEPTIIVKFNLSYIIEDKFLIYWLALYKYHRLVLDGKSDMRCVSSDLPLYISFMIRLPKPKKLNPKLFHFILKCIVDKKIRRYLLRGT